MEVFTSLDAICLNDMSSSRSSYPTPPSSSGSHSPIYATLEVPDCKGIIEITESVAHLQYRMANEEPYLEILEQPVDKFRFRYKSEMSGTHGSLSGRSTIRNRKPTFPTVKLWNHQEPAIIRCSLYTYSKEAPMDFRQPHPHRLVRKHDTKEIIDPHDFEIDTKCDQTVVFKNMGIIHTAKKHIQNELRLKKRNLKQEEIQLVESCPRELKKSEERDIDQEIHEEERSIDLNVVCLRFDAFRKLPNDVKEPLCAPVYSNPIYNLKSAMTGDLKIVRMDACTSLASGNKEIFLLVEKVAKKNIKVQFIEMDEENNRIVWMADAKFRESDVHHQYAIVIRTPPYRNTAITEPVDNIYVQLLRPSDNETSDPKPFTYYPDTGHKRKRGRYEDYSSGGSSSMNIDEVPPIVLHHNNPEMCSDELKRYARNVDSTEFKNLLPEIELLFGGPPMTSSLTYDAATSRADGSKSMNELRTIKKQFYQITAYVKTGQPNVEQLLRRKFDESYINGNNICQLCYIHHQDEHSKKLRVLLLELIKTHNLYDLLTQENNDGECVVHLCIKNGAKLQHLSELPLHKLEIEFTLGFSLMHCAIQHNYGIEELCTRLNKKIVNQVDVKGLTPFQFAVGEGNLAAVKILVAHGAKINAQDNCTGNNVLHEAILQEDEAMVKYLMENTPINKLHMNYEGKDCLAWAQEKLSGAKLRTIYAMLCPEATDDDFQSHVVVKEEEESDSDGEMEIDIKREEDACSKFSDIDMENIPLGFMTAFAALPYDKETVELLYEDLKFGYMLGIEGLEKRNQLGLLMNLALTHGIHISEIYKVFESRGLTDGMDCFNRLLEK